MKSISIQIESKTYDVLIGRGVLEELDGFLSRHFMGLTKILIITDEVVGKLHLEKLVSSIKNWNPVVYTTPSGEKAKTFEVYFDALSAALENRLDRKSVILAFGGGAIGDLAGFVAASFMRGIPFIQIPTTILAHDSAVGGKVAINHPLGKNMIGAFYQPEAVFYDLDFLLTLPAHEIRSGFAEVIKHALIYDHHFYNWLTVNILSLDNLSHDVLSHALERGIRIKGEVVSKDEKEEGIRAFLNFGHTLGHAIESEMGYGNFTHGEAVLIGIHFAIKVSKDLLSLPFDLDEFILWVKKLGYETEIPSKINKKNLVLKMKQDKKSVGDTIRFVLLEQLGKPKLQAIDEDYLLEELNKFK